MISLKDAEKAGPLTKALCEGGIPCVEVTFRTDACVESIRRMTKACPEMLVGAGTVTLKEQAEEAAEAGAKFMVSPGFNHEVVEYCIGHNIAVIPGCSSPTDVEQAMKYGLCLVKFFPAEAAGTAKEMGITVSFDLNYRAKLWTEDITEKQGIMRELMNYLDICFENARDAALMLGYEEAGMNFISGDYQDCVDEELRSLLGETVYGAHR